MSQEQSHSEQTFRIRDPFVGTLEIVGATLDEAIEATYGDIPPAERPAYVWHGDEQVPVPSGRCRPLA